MNSARGASLTRRHVKANSEIISVAIYSQGLTYEGHGATLFAAIDLTEQKKAEQEIRETREFFNTIIDHIPVAVIVKNAKDLAYALVNRVGEEYLGLPREKIVGKTAMSFPRRSPTPSLPAIGSC